MTNEIASAEPEATKNSSNNNAAPSSQTAPVKLRQKRADSASANRKSRPVSTISASSVSMNWNVKKGMDYCNYTSQSVPLESLDGARISRLCEDNKLDEYYFDDVTTLYEGFKRGVRISGDKNCLGYKPSADTPYKWITYNEVDRRSKEFGAGLLALGLQPKNDTRVGLYSQNRPEYHYADIGFIRHSMTGVPLYDTLGIEAGNFIVNQADLSVIICDNNAKVKSLLDRRKELAIVHTIIIMEAASEENKTKASEVGVKIMQFEEVEKLGKENPVDDHPPNPDDLCLVCYTSGTTGMPKGAMISHKNLIVCGSSALKVLETCGLPITPDDVLISYLPLAHSYERVIEGLILTTGAQIGFFQGDVKKLMDDIKELRPTLFPSVPRLLNRFYDKVVSGVNSSKIKKMLFSMAMSSKTKELKKGIIRNNSIWDKLVFKTVQGALGGRVRLITTGSAPISPTVLSFLKCIVGCPILEGYGQTENAGVATLVMVGDTEQGHVGPPLPCTMVKLDDVPDMNYFSNNNKGEVCLKGGNVFKGYLKDPEKTKEAIDAEGWLHTGDIGEWTPSGALKIIDRKKHIFKLAQGEYIAPEKIENILIQSHYLAQVYVHGESLQACLVGIVVLDPETIASLAGHLGVSGTIEELSKNEVLKKAILKDLSDLAKKNQLTSLETLKDIYIYPELFSVENGLLTPTFKTKRNDVRQFFAPQITEMYERINSANNDKPS